MSTSHITHLTCEYLKIVSLLLLLFWRPCLTPNMHDILPILRQAFPTATSYETLCTVVQANAEGQRVLVSDDSGKTSDVFVKQVDAVNYANKSWPDFRRTLMYLRTEVQFYKEIVPELRKRGLEGSTPQVCYSDINLDGLIAADEKATDQSVPEPENWSAEGKGGSIIMESIGEPYFQDSPISLEQAKETLSAVAALHAAAWEDVELLEKAELWLSRGSYHLKTRNVKELAGMETAWGHFSSEFRHLDTELFDKCGDNLGTRIQKLAEYISDEVSPGATDPFATLSHGDFKAMNCFIPGKVCSVEGVAAAAQERGVVMLDFASTGVGLGMSDVAMHIHHAVLPEDLADGGEEALVTHYLETLNGLLPPSKSYPLEIAMRHYRLAVLDYFRFFLGRFWKSATPESFAKKKESKNTALINRNVDSALAFLRRAEEYICALEKEL